jgi:hypothetical protein
MARVTACTDTSKVFLFSVYFAMEQRFDSDPQDLVEGRALGKPESCERDIPEGKEIRLAGDKIVIHSFIRFALQFSTLPRITFTTSFNSWMVCSQDQWEVTWEPSGRMESMVDMQY